MQLIGSADTVAVPVRRLKRALALEAPVQNVVRNAAGFYSVGPEAMHALSQYRDRAGAEWCRGASSISSVGGAMYRRLQVQSVSLVDTNGDNR